MMSEDFLAPRKNSKKATSAVQEFQFLNVTDSPQLDELGKMTVQIQAQRDVHPKKRELKGGLKNLIQSQKREK